MKYLGINLAKEVRDFYYENYKTLMREIEESTNKWKGRTNIVKISIIPKAIYRVDAIPLKIPMSFLEVKKKSLLKFIWNHKRPQIAREGQSRRHHTS